MLDAEEERLRGEFGDRKNISQIDSPESTPYDEFRIRQKKAKEDANLRRIEFQDQLKYSFECFLQIIKFFILSPIEKKYITNIEMEVKRSEELDDKIGELTHNIKNENNRKRVEVRETLGEKENPQKLLRDISIHENKLEKAHQKLNTTISQNLQLRQKIDVLRKEKNVIEDIYKKLKAELEKKRDQIESTIINAGRAYMNRNAAEEELKVGLNLFS